MLTIDDIGGIPGKPPLSAEEKQAFLEEWSAELAARPLRDWQAKMRDTDAEAPRALEDLYDALPSEQQAIVAEPTRQRIALKKTLRADRPWQPMESSRGLPARASRT
jgi:hypothetical protein